jgi:signal transduction histidine kinase
MARATTVPEIISILESQPWILRGWPGAMRHVFDQISPLHLQMLQAVIHVPLLLQEEPVAGTVRITMEAAAACYAMLADIARPLRDMVYAADKSRVLREMQERAKKYLGSPRVRAILSTLGETTPVAAATAKEISKCIGDGLSSLWRSNPLKAAPPPDYQSNQQALSRLINRHQQRKQDQQTDGVVKPIGQALTGDKDPVLAFDIEATERDRLRRIQNLLSNPLEASPSVSSELSTTTTSSGSGTLRAEIADQPAIVFY